MGGIDDYYVWQCRIHHGIRSQKVALPFPESVKIGLDFNAALDRKDKLDQRLLTNAVMLEICDFATTVTTSEKYFLFEMLQFNFDLGVDVDDDMQCYEYATRVHNNIKQLKEQMKQKPRRWAEAFPLPDPKTIKELTMSKVPGRLYPMRNKTADMSVMTGGSKNRQSPENHKSNRLMSSTFITKRRGGSRLTLTGDVHPFCSKLGVTLMVRPDEAPKQKLDPRLVNTGVMMELLDFSRVLCGNHAQLVVDLVKQNFGQELNKLQFRTQLHELMERKHACLTAEDREAFGKQTFTVQSRKREQKHKKRKNPDTDFQDLNKLTLVSKRRETLRHMDSDAPQICQDSDLSYTCPVGFETEMQSEKNNFTGLKETALGTTSTVSVDVKQEEEEALVSPAQPEANGNTCRLLNVCLNKASTNLLSADKYKDRSVKTPKQKVWMRRAARSKHILKLHRVNDLFARSREIGLDFNVDSGNRQNLNIHHLTNWVLWEVFKFATTMTKSTRSFLLDILKNNFNLAFQDDQHLRNFTFYVIAKEKVLRRHPARQKMDFLSSPFQLPEIYNIVDVTTDFQTQNEREMDQQTNGDLSGLAGSQQVDMDPYPFCKKLGFNLWSTQERSPCQKLDLTVLTTGAVLEIFSFIRELCGSVHETVCDILEHNFDLDLQNGATKAAQVILRWFVKQKTLMKYQNISPEISRWLNTVVPLNGSSQSSPQPTRDGLEHVHADNLNLRDHSYHICQEIGLDLDIGTKSVAKPKLDLQMLTRGVLLEVHQFVEQNCNRYVPDLYEILEYNFDLSSQSHRKVEFAWCIASQVIAMVSKNGRKGGYLNAVFELPMEVCGSSQIVCKGEPEVDVGESDLIDEGDVLFIRKLTPVDIEVELE